MKIRGIAFLGAIGVMLSAQTTSLQFDVVYVCPAVNAALKVYSCAGPGNADACDVESHITGQPNQRGKSPRQQVMALLRLCHVQTPAEAQGGRGAALRLQLRPVPKPDRAVSRSATRFAS
jgi:hypothetical protein